MKPCGASAPDVERELSSARSEEPSIQLKTQTQLEQIRRQMSELQQGSVQEEAKRENVIRAPVAGVLTNIAAARGETVAESAPLAVIVPKGSGLHAQLLVPTRAIGFVQPEQEVVLRYDAFPFQRFGQYRGKVERVSRTVWSPGEKVGPLLRAGAGLPRRRAARLADGERRRPEAAAALGNDGQRRHPAGEAQGVGVGVRAGARAEGALPVSVTMRRGAAPPQALRPAAPLAATKGCCD